MSYIKKEVVYFEEEGRKNIEKVIQIVKNEVIKKNNINKVTRIYKMRHNRLSSFKFGWVPAHPTFFSKLVLYDKYGNFDLDYDIAADYDIMLRFLEKYNISTLYIPEVFIKMRIGGESSKNFKSILVNSWECYKVLKKNDLEGGAFTILFKLLWKATQYIK